jgi:hypothetical protein
MSASTESVCLVVYLLGDPEGGVRQRRMGGLFTTVRGVRRGGVHRVERLLVAGAGHSWDPPREGVICCCEGETGSMAPIHRRGSRP